MKNFFNDDDLSDIFAEINAEIEKYEDEEVEDEEMSASQRRYDEIIKKRK